MDLRDDILIKYLVSFIEWISNFYTYILIILFLIDWFINLFFINNKLDHYIFLWDNKLLYINYISQIIKYIWILKKYLLSDLLL
jgi:hypothetical protein